MNIHWSLTIAGVAGSLIGAGAMYDVGQWQMWAFYAAALVGYLAANTVYDMEGRL